MVLKIVTTYIEFAILFQVKKKIQLQMVSLLDGIGFRL